MDDDSSVGWVILAVMMILLFGLVAGALLDVAFPGNISGNPRVQHRVVCDYLGGEQQGKVCVSDGRVLEIDMSQFDD